MWSTGTISVGEHSVHYYLLTTNIVFSSRGLIGIDARMLLPSVNGIEILYSLCFCISGNAIKIHCERENMSKQKYCTLEITAKGVFEMAQILSQSSQRYICAVKTNRRCSFKITLKQ